MKFATKLLQHYPCHLRHVSTLPWEIENSNFLQIFSRYSTKCKQIAFWVHRSFCRLSDEATTLYCVSFVSKALRYGTCYEESHSFTCHPHLYPVTEWAMPAFIPSRRASRNFGQYSFPSPTEDRRLSWPECVYYICESRGRCLLSESAEDGVDSKDGVQAGGRRRHWPDGRWLAGAW